MQNITTAHGQAKRGTRKQHGINVGDEFLYCGSISDWGYGITARLEKDGTGYKVIDTSSGGTLDLFGAAGQFWAVTND